MIGLVDGNNFFVSCERVFNRRLLGKPVAVLSNNDGCCVAMSPELKAMGVPRGTPYFQLKDRESQREGDGGIIFLSSNYELYGDLSRRIVSILRDEAVAVEQYSIDEAFILPPNRPDIDAQWLFDYGKALREKIYRWVGIACGVGFAPTKTLAKIANHIGKKRPEGVFVLPDDPADILAHLPVGEVWGVGRRLPVQLHAEKIFTARDLRDAADGVVRAIGGVSLLRVATELRGIVCNVDRDYDADPESISCSRSFGEPVTTCDALAESLACFTAQAAEKLRKHAMLAAGCNIYAQYGATLDRTFLERTVVFAKLTDATNEMLKAITPAVSSLFVPGYRYRKSGMVFFGIEKVGALQQQDLFSPPQISSASKLYRAIDQLNRRFGRNTVRTASQGLDTQEQRWRMRRDKVSCLSTLDWLRLPTVR